MKESLLRLYREHTRTDKDNDKGDERRSIANAFPGYFASISVMSSISD